MIIAFVLHLLSAVIWIGGMFFAYLCLRPVAATLLEPPQRLALWIGTFRRFFVWVWVAVFYLPTTGAWMAYVRFGEFAQWPPYIHLMMGLGSVMILIYAYVYFGPYRRLRRAVVAQQFPQGGQQLARIRRAVGINLLLGLAVAVDAGAGRLL
jgi:uncharacterized membrane protein